MHEITEDANHDVLTQSRAFPSQGLTFGQMCGFIREMGLEIEFLDARHLTLVPGRDKFMANAIRCFVSAGIPVVAGIALQKPNGELDYHAVIISGIAEHSDGSIKEIYVHDDQVGPYAKVFSDDGFFTWRYGGNEWADYGLITLENLIIPLYHKIRLPFTDVWRIYVALMSDSTILDCEFGFYENRVYKKRLLQMQIKRREEVLAMPMPRYLWSLRAKHEDGTIQEVVLDATAPYATLVVLVDFE